MPPSRKECYLIEPAAPDAAVAALLSVVRACQLPLQVGDSHSGEGSPGTVQVIAAAEGSLTVSSGQRYALLDPGQALAISGLEGYAVQAVSDGLCLQFILRGELPGRLLDGLEEDSIPIFPRGAAAVREALYALQVLEEEYPPVDAGTASACAYQLLMKLHGSPWRREDALNLPALVESAIAIIQEEFPYLEGLDELAERLEVSKAHLIRSFVKKTGISPGKYLTRVRIEYAKLLLRDESASVTYVAEASGFANANYFAKVFRKETGMSPSEYLESAPRQKMPVRPAGRGPVLW